MEAPSTAVLDSQTSSSPALEVEDISVVYQRSIKALEGVSLTVPVGEVVAILGAATDRYIARGWVIISN